MPNFLIRARINCEWHCFSWVSKSYRVISFFSRLITLFRHAVSVSTMFANFNFWWDHYLIFWVATNNKMVTSPRIIDAIAKVMSQSEAPKSTGYLSHFDSSHSFSFSRVSSTLRRIQWLPVHCSAVQCLLSVLILSCPGMYLVSIRHSPLHSD